MINLIKQTLSEFDGLAKQPGGIEKAMRDAFDYPPCGHNPNNYSPLGGWPGGKFYLSKRIAAMLPEHEIYLEPFCGAAWVFFRKKKAKVEILNDYDSQICNFFNVIKNRLDDFLRIGRFALYSREMFNLASLEEREDKVRQAWDFLYILKCVYGGKLYHSKSFNDNHKKSCSLNMNNVLAVIRAAHQRLQGVLIENLPYQEIIARHNQADSLLYLDPPYPDSDKENQYKKGIFSNADYQNLAALLKSFQGKFLMSMAANEAVCELFKDFQMMPIGTRYGVNARYNLAPCRMGQAREVLIANYELKPLCA